MNFFELVLAQQILVIGIAVLIGSVDYKIIKPYIVK